MSQREALNLYSEYEVPRTGLGEVHAVGAAAEVHAVEVALQHDEHPEGEGGQVHAQHHDVQAVPPVQEVAAQALDPHLFALVPEEPWRTATGTRLLVPLLFALMCAAVSLI